MGTPTPPSLIEAFCADGVLDVDYTVIPVPTQVPVSPEIASFSTGFPPATRQPRTSGGIPPRGTDMNGILRMATAHIAWLAAGNGYVFNADVAAAPVNGYNIGAILRSASDPLLCFVNTVSGNTNDPDSVLTGWVPFSLAPLPTAIQSATLPAGSSSVVVTPSVGFLELTGDPGGSTLLNITGGANGQILVVSNVGADGVVLDNAGNLRLPVTPTLIQNDGQSFRYSSTLAKWVKM